MKLPLFSGEAQEKMEPISWIELGEAVEKKIIANETIAYFMARIYLFLEEAGVNV